MGSALIEQRGINILAGQLSEDRLAGEVGFGDIDLDHLDPFRRWRRQRSLDVVRLGQFIELAALFGLLDAQFTALDWEVKPRKAEKAEKADDPQIDEIADFLRYPDKEHDWAQWISGILDQMLVLDATSIYAAPTRGAGVYALQVLDGSTIKPVLDLGGRRPLAPLPAFQQVLKGLPAIDYTADELIYYPQTYRPGRIYGYSRVEQAYDLIESAISRLKSQRGYFDYGNVGDGYFSAPEGWQNVDNIVALEQRWNSMMTGDPGSRRRATFLPSGVEWHPTKTDILADEYDEFLIRLLCFPFGVAPTPFMKQAGLGHGSAQTDHEAAEEGGVASLMQFVERLMSLILAKWWNRPDLEFAFTDDRVMDPKTAADIEDIRLKNGSLTIDEVRDRRGEKPYADGSGSKPMIYGGSAQLLEDAIKPPEPMPAVATALSGVAQPSAVKGNAAEGEAQTQGAEPAQDKSSDKTENLAKAAERAGTKRLRAIFTSYLAAKGKAIAAELADTLVKAAPSDDYSRRIEDAFDGIDWDWSDLYDLVEPALAGIAVAAGQDAVSELGLFDAETLKRVTARATDYARNRAAEMVGKAWVDGELIDNPASEWVISDVTRDMLRSLITTAMEEGQSNAELRAAIEDAGAFSSDRADMIARSETALADIRGNGAGWIESGVVSQAEFSASPDCCDECQAEDGKIVPLSEADDLDLPHPNCLPGDQLVLATGITAATCRPFEGNVVVIHTASGNKLTCTPNHPVLTPDGWVAARLLDVGCDVVSSRLGDWVGRPVVANGALAVDDAENVPASIHDVAESFRRSRQVTTVEVPVSAPYFHGDGEGSEVAVVWADRLLRDGADTPRCKHCGKAILVGRDVDTLSHDSAGTHDLGLDGMGLSNHGSMGLGNLIGAGGGVHARPLETLGFARTSALDAGLAKQARHNDATNAEALRDGILGRTAHVSINHSLGINDRSGPQFDARLLERAKDHVAADAGLDADLTDILAGGVFADAIVDVRLLRFAGHVYNLETKSGTYIAQGVVTHNCRCTWVAVVDEDAAATTDTEEEE